MERIAFGLVMALMLSVGVARADIVYNINLDTSSLGAPFFVNFQLTDGGTPGDNTVTMDSFTFGGGGPLGTSTVGGGASGNLSTSVTLTDTAFLNDFFQEFNPGAFFQFRLTSTANVDASGTPDAFAFSLTDSATAPTFFDVFVTIDLNSANPSVNVHAGDLFGPATLNLPAPTATAVTLVPEPSTLILLASGLACLALRGRQKLRES